MQKEKLYKIAVGTGSDSSALTQINNIVATVATSEKKIPEGLDENTAKIERAKHSVRIGKAEDDFVKIMQKLKNSDLQSKGWDIMLEHRQDKHNGRCVTQIKFVKDKGVQTILVTEGGIFPQDNTYRMQDIQILNNIFKKVVDAINQDVADYNKKDIKEEEFFRYNLKEDFDKMHGQAFQGEYNDLKIKIKTKKAAFFTRFNGDLIKIKADSITQLFDLLTSRLLACEEPIYKENFVVKDSIDEINFVLSDFVAWLGKVNND